MIDEEKTIIRDAITIAARPSNGGVKTFVDPNGMVLTNYVPFRKHDWGWTREHSEFAVQVYWEVHGDPAPRTPVVGEHQSPGPCQHPSTYRGAQGVRICEFCGELVT